MTGDELIRGTNGDDPEVIRAYLNSMEFHVLVNMFARVLPRFFRALAADTLATEEKMRHLKDIMMNDPSARITGLDGD